MVSQRIDQVEGMLTANYSKSDLRAFGGLSCDWYHYLLLLFKKDAELSSL